MKMENKIKLESMIEKYYKYIHTIMQLLFLNEYIQCLIVLIEKWFVRAHVICSKPEVILCV